MAEIYIFYTFYLQRFIKHVKENRKKKTLGKFIDFCTGTTCCKIEILSTFNLYYTKENISIIKVLEIYKIKFLYII